MIIKNNTTKLLVTLSFLLILPFIQKQWLNLYLLHINDISFYSILYYLSGAICPSLVYLISSGLISKKLLFSKIEIALAGRAAETIVFGEGEITQCSLNDISYATNIVREMVTKYGFSIIGPISMDSDNNEIYFGDGLFRRKLLIAENTSSKIDNEIINISKISLNNSIKILKKNRVLLDKLVDILLNQETIDKKVFKLTTSKLLKV